MRKRVLIRLGVLGLAAALLALLVAWSGLVSIAASSGHWPVTRWFLGFTMKQAVKTQSSHIEPPPLTDPALVHRGAAHYATGCAICHGAPDSRERPIAKHMTPSPPYLSEHIHHWSAGQLFWIVKHGIKYSGMPAWPTQLRDDEVWAVVAFLQRLPEMQPERYRQLAFGETGNGTASELSKAVDPVLENCARCHGRHGEGRGPGAFPVLTGQHAEYLAASLQAYARGERHSGIMQPMAAELDPADIRRLAEHYASATASLPEQPVADAAAVQRGEMIATQGLPRQGVPACVQCHGPKHTPHSPMFPKLAGQHAGYIVQQLELFRQKKRGGTPYAHIMRSIAERLEPEQIQDVAAYFASLANQDKSK